MRITSSSSLFLATLASSGSLSALAAPTDSGGDFGTNSIATLAGPVLGGVPGAPATGSDQTNSKHSHSLDDSEVLLSTFLAERRGIAARSPDVKALADSLGLSVLDPLLDTLAPVLAPLGLMAIPALGQDTIAQVKDAISKAGLPLPAQLQGAVPANAHAAFALNAAPTSSTMSEDPASSDYPYEVYPSSYSSGYAAEAAPTPPSPPSLPVPFSALPLSPPLPANPPNTPVPLPIGAPGPAPPAAAEPSPSSTATYNGTASASPPSATSA